MITFENLGRYGRLGNQMFQYATLYSVAKSNTYDFGIPISKNINSKNDYQQLSLVECFENLTTKDSTYSISQYKFQEKNNLFDSSVFNVKDGTDILGYFQSEKYFLKYKKDILNEFKFKDCFLKKVLDIKNNFSDELIAVHMRFGDYVGLNHIYVNADLEYYKKALSMLPEKSVVILFSDELNKARQIMNDIKKRYFIINNFNKYEDLCFMTLCDYHIIANSSFSWWGAWLSQSKKTIAPKRWYTGSFGSPECWNDIYSSNWIVI